jgi:hypothetical protein
MAFVFERLGHVLGERCKRREEQGEEKKYVFHVEAGG